MNEQQLDNNETIQLTNEKTISDINNENKVCKKDKLLICILICPIISSALIIYLLLIYLILQESIKEDMRDEKIILISKPFLYNGIEIKCNTTKPCNMTCYEYMEKIDYVPRECEFNKTLEIIYSIVFIIFSCTIMFELCKYCCGYICFHCSKSKKTKDGRTQIPQRMDV